MVREGKPEGFFYLDHRTVDHKFNIITDVFVTPGNVHHSVPYIDRLEKQMEKFGFKESLEAVALDAGYFTYLFARNSKRKTFEGYRQYKSDPSHCQNCPLLKDCTRSKNKQKVVTRHVWQDSKE